MSDPTKPSPYRERNRAYYLANREACLARAKAWRVANAERRRAYVRQRQVDAAEQLADYKLRKAFGITLADHAAMLANQGGACAICRRPESAVRNGRVRLMAVDHDHDSGAIRGLLCNACNTALGLFGDDIAVMEAAIDYLTRHSKEKAA